jgi:hypothetical protein
VSQNGADVKLEGGVTKTDGGVTKTDGGVTKIDGAVTTGGVPWGEEQRALVLCGPAVGCG